MFKIQNTKLITVLLSGLLIVFSVVAYNFALGSTVLAQDCTNTTTLTSTEYKEQCACKGDNLSSKNCGIIAYIALFVRFLSAAVGIVVVTMITVGGIQYSSARDNPQATQAARGKIYNAILALVVYMFMFAFLQWLVPGGIV